MLHPTLIRQLRKCGLEAEGASPTAQWEGLLERVSRTYGDADQDRYRLERSLTIMSDEMVQLYDELKERTEARIRESERAEEALRHSEARFRSLVQNGSDIIAILDLEGALSYVSPSLLRVLGYQPEAWMGQSLGEWLHPDDSEQIRALFMQMTCTPGCHPPFEMRLKHFDGTWRCLETTATSLLDDIDVSGIVLNLRDITDRKRLEEQLINLAFWDPLTGLANRALFKERLRLASKAPRDAGANIAVLFVDLDRFKSVNDSMGHAAGDRLLNAVAHRLNACVREGDTVARLGGDEFTVLLEDVRDDQEIFAVVERITAQLQLPFYFDDNELVISASIGIAKGDGSVSQADTLVRQADVAMYAAKLRGRALSEVYRPELDERTRSRLELEGELRRGIARNELRLHYQPIIDLKTGSIQGVEGLVRWQHPQRGLLGPVLFIPIAEQSDLILGLGTWVLEEGLRQARAWQLEFPEQRIEVSLNLSARQLARPDLLESVGALLERSELDPTLLKLEITESAALEDARAAIQTMYSLKGLGIRLAIDDFGTGYSSLAYLKRFPVDTLKIDRSFVDGLGSESEDTAIVRAILGVASALSLNVTAEGVETPTQVEALLALGCHAAQGYLFAKPMSAESLSELLRCPPSSFKAICLGEAAAVEGLEMPATSLAGPPADRRGRTLMAKLRPEASSAAAQLSVPAPFSGADGSPVAPSAEGPRGIIPVRDREPVRTVKQVSDGGDRRGCS